MTRAIAVVGPTGSGKTRLAIEIARRLGTEIISADAMQFYRGMEIGAAAPTAEERALAHHRFISFLDPDASMAAGAYQRLARAAARELLDNGRMPVLAGGSGLYLSAFIDGLFEGPARNQALRDRLRAQAAAEGNAALMARLRDVDPQYAAQLTSENDQVRIVRALEVHEITGRPFSWWHRRHQEAADAWNVLQLAPAWERARLYERIERRVVWMVENGWIEETQRLVAAGYEPHLLRLKALGYREVLAYLRGEQSLDDAVQATCMHHRRYAKRQLTWFRADPRVRLLQVTPPEDLDGCVTEAMSLIGAWMRATDDDTD